VSGRAARRHLVAPRCDDDGILPRLPVMQDRGEKILRDAIAEMLRA